MVGDNKENLEQIFNLLNQAGKLKTTLRFSELDENSLRDSSAEHSWRLSLMVFVVADKLKLDINVEHALKLAIIHDIAESITGDVDSRLVYAGKITKEEKKKAEEKAIKEISKLFYGKEIFDLWKEYEGNSTKESRYIKALDKIETLIHLIEMGMKMGPKVYDIPEMIIPYADKSVNNFPELTSMLKIVKNKLKKEFQKNNILWKEEYDKLI